MIQEIRNWAVGSWHIVEARTALPMLSRADGPVSLLDLDARYVFAVIEGILRESPDHAKILDQLYAEARPAVTPPSSNGRSARNREIAKLTRIFGG